MTVPTKVGTPRSIGQEEKAPGRDRGIRCEGAAMPKPSVMLWSAKPMTSTSANATARWRLIAMASPSESCASRDRWRSFSSRASSGRGGAVLSVPPPEQSGVK